ncbi:MAG: TlpA disulfide reductase family protein [Proteobacteria bacterium]|jgi:thiol-disulfide isomerase/thioredoxin|nr:TlpA disulfide reductase family protein [Pseudomonadota bacterium]MDA1136441.1 TlpA disulfide reductase family protein [Pseudomonadota bacterium]
MKMFGISKKYISMFIFIWIISGNALANDVLKKTDLNSKFPIIKIINNQGKPFTLKFNNFSKKNGYVINFWATWCVPCKKELPDLNLLHLKLKQHKIDVITVSIDNKRIEEQMIFLSNNGASDLLSFFDKKMALYKALNLRGIPTTVLVDRNGYIISKHEGILEWGKPRVISNILNLFN